MQSTLNKAVGIEVGTQFGPGEWFQVNQDQINQFADCTLDHQFIHVDEKAAAQSPFGSTVAHGFLTLSMLSHFMELAKIEVPNRVMGVNYGFDKVRFINPVKVGQKIRAVFQVSEVVEKAANQISIRFAVTIEIEGETKPALTAEWLTLHFF